VVVDVFRIKGGKLAEHWDVLPNEEPSTAALGGIAMFAPEEGAPPSRP
jgi:predicted SnoaL-like aldol condensation-catalyzing enzyme